MQPKVGIPLEEGMVLLRERGFPRVTVSEPETGLGAQGRDIEVWSAAGESESLSSCQKLKPYA